MNTTTTTGTNTMNQDNTTHIEHSETTRIPSVWDDSNHIIDTLPTNHLPSPTEYRSEVAMMFDFLCGMQDRWILTGSTKQLVEWARDELIKNGRSDFYHECISELCKMYKGCE